MLMAVIPTMRMKNVFSVEVELNTSSQTTNAKYTNQSSKAIANPPSEIESFELFLSEDILQIVLMHTNRRAKEIRSTVL